MSPFQNHFFSRLSCYLGKHLLQFHTVHSVCSWGVEQKHAKLWGEKIESTHLLCHSFVILRIPMIRASRGTLLFDTHNNIKATQPFHMKVLAAVPLAAVSHSFPRWPAQLRKITIWQSPPCLSYCKWFICLIDARQANRPSPGASVPSERMWFFSKQQIKNWHFLARVCWALQKKSVNRSNIKNILFILLLLRICVFINVINLMSYSPAFSMICFLFLHPVLMKDRCKLFCRVAGTTAYYQLKDRVIDGTPCGPDTYDICVQGLCRVFLSVSSFMMSVHNNTHTQASTSTSA